MGILARNGIYSELYLNMYSSIKALDNAIPNLVWIWFLLPIYMHTRYKVLSFGKNPL